MTRGKKTTVKFDRRINIRLSAEDWHKVMLKAQSEHLPPSTWIRKKVLDFINGK